MPTEREKMLQGKLYTATDPALAAPVAIGQRVWIGGAAVSLPGVTIGDDTTIAAGSVVTRDVPAGLFTAGNPARVTRAAA